MAHF